MIKYEIMQQSINQLQAAEENLNRIRETYKEEPFLLEIYENTALHLVDNLKTEFKTYMDREIIFVDQEEPDIWFRLKGSAFENGRAPLGVVGNFLQKLQTSNQHALAILGKIKYNGLRMSKEVRNLVEMDFVAATPGSLRLGLKRPSVKRYLQNIGNEQLIDIEDFEELIKNAKEKSNLPLEGIDLLVKAISAAEDDEKFEKLKVELNDMESLLKLLFYAREITPASNSQIDAIEITGINISKGKSIVPVTKNTRMRLKERANALIKNETYIQATGVVRELDLESYKFRIHNVSLCEKYYDQIECRVSKEEYSEEDLQNILSRNIKVSGIMIFSEKGEVKWINIDTFEELMEEWN